MGTGGSRLLAGLVVGLLLQGCVGTSNNGTNATSPSGPTDSTGGSTAGSTSESRRAQSGPIVRSHARTVVIEGVHVTNPRGHCIHIMNSTNVVIRDSIVGPCAGTGVRVRGSSGVKIEGSEFRDTDGGIYALASESVSVSDNTFRGTGRNPIQFDKVRGSGNAVVSNIIQNEPGNPLTEDSINIYMSGGTPESPLVVANNLIRGGGSSSSGSGIMVGDNGGSFTEVVENLLIEPGQVGIGVAGGHDITVRDNVVYSAARQWTNVGIYVWDQYDSDCSGIEVRGNLVEFYSSSGDPNRYFDGGNCGPIDGWEANEEAVGLLGRLDQIEMDLIGAS